MSRSIWLPLLAVTLFATACGDTASLPESPTRSVPQGGLASNVAPCTSNPAQIQSALSSGFTSLPNTFTATNTWNAVVQATNANNPALAKTKAFALIDFLLLKNSQHAVALSPAALASLMNQIFCFVGINAEVGDPQETWVVHVGDTVTTLETKDDQSGAQFPHDAVLENTVVTVRKITDPSAINTPLDKYAFIYDWNVSPPQTLKPGTKAIIGVCPNPAEFANVPAGDLAALLARLVLGHQKDPNTFEVLPRVNLPPEMQLTCGDVTAPAMASSWGGRVLNTLASLVLPAPLAAARRLAGSGGIGGATSEFSPFEPVDPQLFASGGVGGSTSEFVRDALLVTTIDGTVGTTRTGAGLPSVTVKTRLGTPIPGIVTTWETAASTVAPYSTKPGNASVCGADAVTNASGTAAVSCINFGTTSQFRTAYTKLTATLTVPPDLDESVIVIIPDVRGWLLASYGASNLVFTQPAAGTYSADATIPARVEVRSDLGTVVPTANQSVTLSLNQNTFLGGATTLSTNAVNGVATFATRVPKVATGYRFAAAATLSDVGAVSSTTGSNFFDIVVGAAAKIAIVGPANVAGPIVPAPKVLVTDATDNPKSGTTVYWTPGGATGGTANGSPSQTTTTSGNDGTTSASWVLGEGENQLRAALQSAPGGAEVFFTASLNSALTTLNACLPGGAKDDITGYYFVVPGPTPSNGSIRSVGLYLSAQGTVGQADPTGYPMTLVATRVVKNASSGNPETQSFSSTVTAFLRGDNGSSGSVDRLVTFGFNIPVVPSAQLVTRNKQPDLTLYFQLPSGGYGRRINFNAGPCSTGRNCSPPPACNATEYAFPISSANSIYRKSVALLVKGVAGN